MSEDDKKKRKLKEDDLEWMNIPPEFWRVQLANVQEANGPVVSRYISRIREMVTKPAGLLITGEPGVGKTAIAVLIMKAARLLGLTCLFLTVWELREMIRNHVEFDDNKTMLDRCREVDLLVIDHLRQEDLKEHYVNLRFLEELVAHRGSHKKTTILTTNMSREVVTAEMKPFIKATQGYVIPLQIEGEDLRRTSAAELLNDVFGKKRS